MAYRAHTGTSFGPAQTRAPNKYAIEDICTKFKLPEYPNTRLVDDEEVQTLKAHQIVGKYTSLRRVVKWTYTLRCTIIQRRDALIERMWAGRSQSVHGSPRQLAPCDFIDERL